MKEGLNRLGFYNLTKFGSCMFGNVESFQHNHPWAWDMVLADLAKDTGSTVEEAEVLLAIYLHTSGPQTIIDYVCNTLPFMAIQNLYAAHGCTTRNALKRYVVHRLHAAYFEGMGEFGEACCRWLWEWMDEAEFLDRSMVGLFNLAIENVFENEEEKEWRSVMPLS